MNIVDVYYVSGFGGMGWVPALDYLQRSTRSAR